LRRRPIGARLPIRQGFPASGRHIITHSDIITQSHEFEVGFESEAR
jgi:hypothetical protein